MAYPDHCPACNALMDGGPIPENIRQHYSPPYRWSRVIAIIDRDRDRQVAWRCPDCNNEWPLARIKEATDAPDKG